MSFLLLWVLLALPSLSWGTSYKLAICTMFKDEKPWLIEWIEYHRMIGVEHFYLYDNESKDGSYAILMPYIEDGLVEVIPWENTLEHWDERGVNFDGYQIKAFNDCIGRSYGIASWLAIVDVDEYIVPVFGKQELHDILEKTELGAIKLHWLIYGTSHVWEVMQDELLTEKLSKRASDRHEWHHFTKCIYRPEAVIECSVHEARLKSEYKEEDVPFSSIRIQHYWTRDQRSWLKKRLGIQIDCIEELSGYLSKEQFEHVMEVHEQAFNEVEDKAIYPYLDQLRERVHLYGSFRK